MPSRSFLGRLVRALGRIAAIASKESVHIRRDPQTLTLALVMPVLLLLLFGFGVTLDLDNLPVLAVDEDHTHVSREVIQRFGSSSELALVGEERSVNEALVRLRRTEAVAILVIPRGFSRSLARGDAVDLELLVDGSDATSATQAINKADALVSAAVSVGSKASLASVPRMVVDTWTLYNPAGRSALLLVPGLVAYILAIVAVLLTALTVAREWERGSMEQLFTTPVRREEIILGKLLPYVGLGVMGVLMVLTAGAWVFDVPIRGSLIALTVASVLFLVGMLGQGLLISVVTKNQMVATQVGVFSSLLPTMLLSGFIFPIANMPRALQVIAEILPATHFIAAMRGILLRGNGFSQIFHELVALTAFGIVVITLASARFRRRLD